MIVNSAKITITNKKKTTTCCYYYYMEANKLCSSIYSSSSPGIVPYRTIFLSFMLLPFDFPKFQAALKLVVVVVKDEMLSCPLVRLFILLLI